MFALKTVNYFKLKGIHLPTIMCVKKVCRNVRIKDIPKAFYVYRKTGNQTSSTLTWMKSVINGFRFFFVMSLWPLASPVQRKAMVVMMTNIPQTRVPIAQLQMKFKWKRRSMMHIKHMYFFCCGKQNGHGWNITHQKMSCSAKLATKVLLTGLEPCIKLPTKQI